MALEMGQAFGETGVEMSRQDHGVAGESYPSIRIP